MSTSQMEFLSRILDRESIPEGAFVYFRGDLENQAHSLLLRAYRKRHSEQKLSQKEYAARINHSPEVVNRHIAAAGNWEIDTIADYFLGLHARIVLSVVFLEDLRASADPAPSPSQHGVIGSLDTIDVAKGSNRIQLQDNSTHPNLGITSQLGLASVATGANDHRKLVRPRLSSERSKFIKDQIMNQSANL